MAWPAVYVWACVLCSRLCRSWLQWMLAILKLVCRRVHGDNKQTCRLQIRLNVFREQFYHHYLARKWVLDRLERLPGSSQPISYKSSQKQLVLWSFPLGSLRKIALFKLGNLIYYPVATNKWPQMLKMQDIDEITESYAKSQLSALYSTNFQKTYCGLTSEKLTPTHNFNVTCHELTQSNYENA